MDEITEKADSEIFDPAEFEDDLDVEEPNFSAETQFSRFAPPEQAEQNLFSLKERFAAFLIDAMLTYLLYWPAALLFRQVAFQQSQGPIPLISLHGLVFHGLFLLFLLITTTFMLGLFGATPGKWLCKLRVRRTNGTACGLIPALIRTIFFPVDLVCFLLFFGLIFFESSPLKQRLGDRFAKTYVLNQGRNSEYHQVSTDLLASASGRTIAGCIDLVFMLALSFAYALFLTPDEPELSMLLLVWFPVVLLFSVSLLSTLSQSSPGKTFFGYIVCHEDGQSITFASSLIRNLMRLSDLLLFGFFSMLISNRKQRLGDTAAGTIVIKAGRSVKSFIGLLGSFAFILILWMFGTQQSHNFLSTRFEVNFLPSFESGTLLSNTSFATRDFALVDVHFAADRDELDLRSPPIYKPGETVYLFFSVQGYSQNEDFAWLNEDVIVRYPDNSEALKMENAIEYRERSADNEPIQMVNNFALAPNSAPGRYSISILLRDRHARKELQEQRFFYVNP